MAEKVYKNRVKEKYEKEVVPFLMKKFGYTSVMQCPRLFAMDRARRRTLSIEVGMQNAGLATNLAANFFMAANPLSVVPCAISCVWHSISGTLLAQLFVRKDKRNGKETETE